LKKLRRTKIVAFKTLYISQGSVATHLRCVGIFNDSIITNFSPDFDIDIDCDAVRWNVIPYISKCKLFAVRLHFVYSPTYIRTDRIANRKYKSNMGAICF